MEVRITPTINPKKIIMSGAIALERKVILYSTSFQESLNKLIKGSRAWPS